MNLWLPEDDVLLNNPDLLQQTLQRYRRVLNGSGYAFWEWGLNDNTYRCGGSFWEKLGYSTIDESVTPVNNVQEYVHPDDFEYVYNVILKHLRFNTPIDMVYRIRACDGSYWWTQACANSTRGEDGRVTYLSGVNFDLSHLKETEKALRLSEARHERILAGSNDGIWEWSVNDENSYGRRFHYSYSCWEHLGYSEMELESLPEKELLSIWNSHIHPHDLVSLKKALKQHFTRQKPFDTEYRMFAKGGKMFWIRSRGQALFNSQGRAILISGINIDITALKQAEERVRKAKDDAERANKAKSIFLSNMSHELRTPLNAIMGFSQLLMNNDQLELEQKNNAQQIHQAGEHLLQLINDVLDLSKIEAGVASLLIEPVSPYLVVRECFGLVYSLAKQRNIRLSCDKHCEHTYVHADKMRLKQCLLNLIGNAVKYNADNGEVVVNFTLFDESLEVSVSDTGGGIPDDRKDELFQAFNRLGVEHSGVEGSGLGLVIAKKLIEKMQGSICYSESRTKGACFKIRLPVAKIHSVTTSRTWPEDVDLSLDVITGTKTVLYIEDNISNIVLMEELLAPYPQINLVSYSDPFMGLYCARTQAFDFIILDIGLPGLSGLELVKLLKAEPLTQRTPIVALSANAMVHDINSGKRAGFDEYLTKPLNIKQLLRVFKQFLVDEPILQAS